MITNRTIHRLARLLVLVAAIALMGLAQNPKQKPANPQQQAVLTWRIEPGKVEPIFGGPNGALSGVSGSFKLVKDPNGSIMRRGGGCLIFQPTDEPTPCTADSTCPKYGLGQFESAYCALKPGFGKGGSCWTKRDESYCLKSPTQDLEPNKVYTVPASTPAGADAFPLGASRRVQWRMVTCQSLVPGGCGSGDPAKLVLEYGHIWKKP